MEVIRAIFSLKSYILLPLFMLILTLIFSRSLAKAAKAALFISVALIGIGMLFDFFIENTTPVVEVLAEKSGKSTTIIDVGWPKIATLVWSVDVIYLIIPISFGVNALMLFFKWTDSFNVDIWNYWHIAVASFLVYYNTGSVGLVVVADVIMVAVTLKLCDWTRPFVQRTYGVKGNIGVSTINSLTYFPIAIACTSLIDKIPGLRKVSIVPSEIKGKWRWVFNTGVISIGVGLLLPLWAGYDFLYSVEFAVKMAAVFLILERVVYFMKEGFAPVADAAEGFVKRHIKGDRKIVIGVNHMILTDNPTTIISGIILLPITILMSLAIPWINIIPMGDLTNIVCVIVIVVAVSRGDVVRSVITGIPVMLLNLVMVNWVAPAYTNTAAAIGFDIPGITTESFAASMNGNNYVSVWVAEALSGSMGWLLSLPLLFILLYISYRYYRKHRYLAERIL